MKKRAAMGLAGLAAVAVIGGTWAYWNQDLKATNEFETGKFDSDIVEEFMPPAVGEWLPGVAAEKDVKVVNSGNVDMAVIAEISQEWSRDGQTLPLKYEDTDESGTITRGSIFPAVVNWDDDNSKNMPNVAAVSSMKGKAKTLGIETVVSDLKEAEAKDKWILVGSADEEESSYSKLYFIYNGIVPAEEETPSLLNSVTLNSKLEAGVTGKTYTYAEDGTLVTEEKVNKNNYDNAQYTMTIHVNTVQATEDAISDVFSDYAGNIYEGAVEDFISANAEFIKGDMVKASDSNTDNQ